MNDKWNRISNINGDYRTESSPALDIPECFQVYSFLLQYYLQQKYSHFWLLFMDLNPLRANIFRGNRNIYLHFMSFLDFDMTQEVEIIVQIRKKLTYST